MDKNVSLYEPPEVFLAYCTSLPHHISLEPFLGLKGQSTAPQPSSSDEEDLTLAVETKPKRTAPRRRRRPGRRVSKENVILRKFVRIHEIKKKQPPKLENIRYRVMRTLKKVIRRVSSGKAIKPKGLLQFSINSTPGAYWKSELENFIIAHSVAIEKFADVQNGPKVDQCKPSGEASFSTYNNPYLESVFASEEVRVAYQLFVRFIFSDERPQSLSQRFRILCCKTNLHSIACTQKWTDFRKMLESYMGAKVSVADGETLLKSFRSL